MCGGCKGTSSYTLKLQQRPVLLVLLHSRLFSVSIVNSTLWPSSQLTVERAEAGKTGGLSGGALREVAASVTQRGGQGLWGAERAISASKHSTGSACDVLGEQRVPWGHTPPCRFARPTVPYRTQEQDRLLKWARRSTPQWLLWPPVPGTLVKY